MATIPVLDHDGVLAAVSPAEAIERVRDGFVSFARGEWQMPAKVYLPSPPNGDFRAMPVRGEGLAMLKWVTSFPGQPAPRPADGDRDRAGLRRRQRASRWRCSTPAP